MTRILDTAMIRAGFEAEYVCGLEHRKYLYAANMTAILAAVFAIGLAITAWV